MFSGVLKIFRAVVLAFLVAGLLCLVGALFGTTRTAPEQWVLPVGRTALMVGGFVSGLLGANSTKHTANGLLAALCYLLVVLLASLCLPNTDTEIGAKYLFLGAALLLGALGGISGGGKHRTKVVRRKRRGKRA